MEKAVTLQVVHLVDEHALDRIRKMQFPYQCLASREATETGEGGWTLFGACGSTLVAQSSSGGTSIWTKPDEPVAVSCVRSCCRNSLMQAACSRHGQRLIFSRNLSPKMRTQKVHPRRRSNCLNHRNRKRRTSPAWLSQAMDVMWLL